MLHIHPSSPLHSPFIIKKIGFKEKVVSDVTSETTFSLKSIFLREIRRQRMDEWCISSIYLLENIKQMIENKGVNKHCLPIKNNYFDKAVFEN
jgi:hypothetical protein